ncbi:hypothetical protein C8F01DRAFT_1248140 [Mycena amicta]|nr:hypothetical protein C8F01DRAFT_1248140 [Mycena amicta]
MSPRHKYTTDQERLDARRLSKLKYDQSSHGRVIRGARVRIKRKIAKKHISRLVLPDLVEDWACADLRRDYEIFSEALQADFDETESIHWLHPPPFNTEAIALAEDRADYDDYSNYYVSCLVDGCLLRREQRREEAFKQELAGVGKKEMVNRCRVELQGLLAGEWADMQGQKSLYQPGTREHTIYERHVIFLARNIYRMLHQSLIVLCRFSLPSSRHQSDLTLASTRPGANHSLPVDPSLPAGALQFVQNAERTEPFCVSIVGRVVGMVQRPREKRKYLILEAPYHAPLQQDFKSFIRALEVIPAWYAGLFSKRVNNWCQQGRDDVPGLTKHAWDIDWIEPSPPTAEITVLQTGGLVFCVGHLLRIQRPEFVNDEHVVSDLHYIIKGTSVTHIHWPTAYEFEEDPEVARFLSTGLLPGAVPKQDEI